LGAVAACSVLVKSDRDQCATDGDCERFGAGVICVDTVCTAQTVTPVKDAAASDAKVDAAPPDPKWGCAGGQPTLVEKNVTMRIVARFESLDGGALDGLTVKGCSNNDSACTKTLIPPATTDSEGRVNLPVTIPIEGGFRGFLDTGPTTGHPDLDVALFAVQPGSDFMVAADAGDYQPKFPVKLLTSTELEAYATKLGSNVTLNPEAGHILFTALDCQWERAVNATVSPAFRNADTLIFYFDENGVPVSDSTQKATASSAQGGILNIPPGAITIKLARDDGKNVATQNVVVRKGAVSYLFLSARP
jgi:hypothetical protein